MDVLQDEFCIGKSFSPFTTYNGDGDPFKFCMSTYQQVFQISAIVGLFSDFLGFRYLISDQRMDFLL